MKYQKALGDPATKSGKDTSIENYDNRVVQKKRNIKSFDVSKRVI